MHRIFALCKGMTFLAHFSPHSMGAFTAMNNPWGSKALKTRWRSEMEVITETDPVSFTIETYYPGVTDTRVKGFPAAQFGAGMGCRPLKPWPARQIRDITAPLEQRFELGWWNGVGGEGNILAETFLVASSGDDTKGLLELGFHLRPNGPLQAFAAMGKKLPAFTDRHGQAWAAYLMPPKLTGGPSFLMLVAPALITKGALCWDQAVQFAVANAGLSDTAWMRGTMVGMEPVSGLCRLRVKKLSGLVG